jgi:hypothetical protein
MGLVVHLPSGKKNGPLEEPSVWQEMKGSETKG